MKRLTAALVDVNFENIRKLPTGTVVVDVQGNRYLVFHDCSSIDDALVDKFIPFYLTNLVEIVGDDQARRLTEDPPFLLGDDVPENLADCPPELIDVDWFKLTFRNGVAVDDGDAVVRCNELSSPT